MSTIKANALASKLLTLATTKPLHSNLASSTFWRLIRKIVLLFGDPACKITPAGLASPLLIPLSHEMPHYRANFPRYDRLPPIIANLIREKEGSLHMIDVGANVGDTILSTQSETEDHYLALEPHPFFFSYLLENMSNRKSVTCIQIACSDRSGQLNFHSQRRGTASAGSGDPASNPVNAQLLDEIWQAQWNKGRVNFLKIDTDGFDASVIRGAHLLLKAWQPWIYFEFDASLTPGGATELIDSLDQLKHAGYESALLFDNFGEYQDCLALDQIHAWSRIISNQRSNGPIYYHDVLVIPQKAGPPESILDYIMRSFHQSFQPKSANS